MGGNRERRKMEDERRKNIKWLKALNFLLPSSLFLLLFISVAIAQNQPSAPQGPAQTGLSGLNTQEFENKSQQNVNWQNNPFVQPANDVAVSDLKLTGIAYSDKESAAIINDIVLQEGDKIGSHQVVKINPDSVVLKNDNGVFNLSFKAGGGASAQ